MSGLPGKKKKKRALHEDQANMKKVKLDSSGGEKRTTLPFETNTLSLPVQEALNKFKQASEQELIRLKNEGMNPHDAINKLVEKMRSEEDTPSFSRQEVDMVMEIAGVNEEGATRALILRSELAKLREDGFNHPEAINELSRRMRRLAGSKRRGVSPPPHFSSSSLTTISNTDGKNKRVVPSSRVSFTQLVPFAPINRKRLQDALMMDEEQLSLIRKRHKYEKDLSDSEGSEEDGEQFHFDDVAEFSQDEEKDLRAEGDSDDVNSPEDMLPPHASFNDFSPSSSEGEDFHKDLQGEEEEGGSYDWLDGPAFVFHPVKEEESDSDDTWQLASSSSRTPIPSTTSTTSTTTTATEPTTEESTLPYIPMFSTLPPSMNTTRRATRFGLPNTTKRRDSNTPRPLPHIS